MLLQSTVRSEPFAHRRGWTWELESTQMDLVLIAVVAIPFGLIATALWVTYRVSRNGKREKREVGYQREEIQINAAAVPEFKPTWRDMRAKGER